MINLLDYVTGQILLGRIKGPPEDAAKFLRLDGSAISLGGAGELIFLRVTGNGGPDSPNGDYAYYGEHNGFPAYQTVIDGTTYYLTKGVIIGPDDDKYRITENAPVGQGGIGHAWSGPADGTIEGDYTAFGPSGATGAPNVEVFSVAAAASASATAAAASAAAAVTAKNQAEIARDEVGADLAETQADLSRRSLEPVLHFVGTGGMMRSELGPEGLIGNDPTSILVWTYIPASGGTVSIFTISPIPDAWSSNSLSMRLTSGDLEVFLSAAGAGNYLRKRVSGFRATFGGSWVLLGVSRANGEVEIMANGKVLSATDAPAGTPPSDWSGYINSVWLILGRTSGTIEFWSGPLAAPRLYNRALTAAEIAAYLKNGDTFDDLAGGSQVDFDTGQHATFSNGAGGATIIEDAAGRSVEITAAGSNQGFPRIFIPLGTVSGTRYRAVGAIALAGGADLQNTTNGLRLAGSGNASWITVSPVAGGYTFSAEVTASGPGLELLCDGTKTGTITLTSLSIKKRGLIINPEVTRTAQVIDRGPNRIRGLLTPGVTPLGGKMRPITFKQSATGFVLGDQNIIFDGHFIDRVRVRPTTATIPNLTLRRTSSSGTVVVDTVTSGTENVWTDLPITSAARASDTTAKYHLTFSTAAEVEVEITPSRKY